MKKFAELYIEFFFKVAIYIMIGIVVGYLACIYEDSKRANAQEAFDHSQCQYPLRTTNPANGCDNSDPCDPQDAVKGGSGECKDPEPVKQPVEPKEETVQPINRFSEPAVVEGCGK